MRARLNGHAARHFAHRREQRKAAARIGDGFISDADGTGLEQPLGLFGIGCEMEIGEQRLAFAQALDLDGLRLLHLHDHLAGGEHFVGVRQNLRSDAGIHFVVQADGFAGLRLDEHFMAARGQFAHGGRRHADAIFVVLDFPGDTDAHGGLPWFGAIHIARAEKRVKRV